MAQPEVVYPLLADPLANGSGFLARFLATEPPSNIGHRLSSKALPDTAGAIPAFNKRMREILDTAMPMDEETRELSPRLLRLSSPARALLQEFSDEVEREQAAGGRLHDHTAVASKAAEHAVRIAAVLTLWENPSAEFVPAEAMEWGKRLASYYVSEAVRLADASSLSEALGRAEALRKWLLDVWNEDIILPTDVIQRAPIRGLRTAAAAKAAIAILVQHGWLIPLPERTEIRGRIRREAYRIVRSALDD